jgi:hypothetical protein
MIRRHGRGGFRLDVRRLHRGEGGFPEECVVNVTPAFTVDCVEKIGTLSGQRIRDEVIDGIRIVIEPRAV